MAETSVQVDFAEQRRAMLSAYARALGLRAAVPATGTVSGMLAIDFNGILDSIGQQISDVYQSFYMDSSFFWGDKSKKSANSIFCNATDLASKLNQFISYLEHIHHLNSTIVEIGSLYNSIKDPDLKSRCSDLLSAPGHFDRAINQATQVLEDKIKKKSGVDTSATGTDLVNKIINTNPERGVLRIFDNNEEHEGIGHICRGLMLAFRNTTHQSLSDSYSREDALKVCAFIDNMISAVENATMVHK